MDIFKFQRSKISITEKHKIQFYNYVILLRVVFRNNVKNFKNRSMWVQSSLSYTSYII